MLSVRLMRLCNPGFVMRKCYSSFCNAKNEDVILNDVWCVVSVFFVLESFLFVFLRCRMLFFSVSRVMLWYVKSFRMRDGVLYCSPFLKWKNDPLSLVLFEICSDKVFLVLIDKSFLRSGNYLKMREYC